jgi:sec-independent protein translocase protein TatC
MTENKPAPEQEQPFISHLLELRDRLLRMLLVVLVIFVVLFPFANEIYTWVASPLMAHLPAGTSMIATEVASPFLTPFKLSLVAAIFLAMPFILHQFWAFVAPGLYQHEKRLAMPLLVSSVVLFYVGMLFAYFVVFPLVFGFLTGTAPEGVAVMTDIARYLDFVLTLFFAFGLAFEVPIATILLVATGVTTPESLAGKRPYIIVGAFAIGMLLTPPDVISQTLLALPMWVLFELGVIFSRMVLRQRRERGDEPVQAPESAMQPAGGPVRVDEPAADLNSAEDLEQAVDSGRFRPMTDAEMEAELDAIEADEQPAEPEPSGIDPVDELLQRVQRLRDQENLTEARDLLYQVLEQGDADQRRVARNILAQLD